jgi:hypothetical protein
MEKLPIIKEETGGRRLRKFRRKNFINFTESRQGSS